MRPKPDEASAVIARSEATKQSILSPSGAMDCFASLAMTGMVRGASNVIRHPGMNALAFTLDVAVRSAALEGRRPPAGPCILRDAAKWPLLRMTEDTKI
jgi:hypothetical protein